MKIKLAILVGCLALVGCTNPDAAVKTLQRSGFTNIEITGYRAFLCGDDYNYSTGFRAKALNGETVTGTVCSGFLKGNSVKLDD